MLTIGDLEGRVCVVRTCGGWANHFRGNGFSGNRLASTSADDIQNGKGRDEGCRKQPERWGAEYGRCHFIFFVVVQFLFDLNLKRDKLNRDSGYAKLRPDLEVK